MGFFDLNIPYYESDKHIADKAARKTTRLKLVVKTMELGYTGVAYNRTIKGVMSESDRCATPRFPLSSVLKLAPSLSAAVKFHRGLLNVPLSAPFRQYTRLTVSVDSSSQASALNSGNPILKTYDIVAVRPLNQNAFEQACRASEVDLIAIDFSEKLPFRLKQPMVKAAIERGVYFEISYSGLIMDAQVRRQMISNAKLLVDWTRGKNLIFSSAAPSVTELRGPYDVANLSSLLGLHMEHAKAALSKNCRSLLANALRKKQYYKEAIRVEGISSGEQFDCKEPCFSEWLKWDPISSGEGDLLLDDMARSFSATNKVSKTVKAIDFASVMESLPSRGLHVQDLKSATEAAVQQLDIGKNLPVAAEEVVTQTAEEEPKNSVGLADHNATFRTSAMDTEIATFHTSAMDTEIAAACDAVTDAENSTPPKDIDFFAFQSEDFKRSSCSDVVLGTQDDVMEEVFIETDTKVKEDLSLTSYDVSLPEDLIEREKFRETRDDSVSREKLRETRDDSVSVADVLPIVEYCDKIEDNNDHLVANCEPPDEVAMEEQKQTEDHDEINCRAFDDSSGRRKVKRRTPNQVFLSPFKRFLKPTPFKRKAQKSKTKARLL